MPDVRGSEKTGGASSPPAPPRASAPPPPSPAEETQPDQQVQTESASETQEGSMSAVDQVHARMAAAREDEEKNQRKLNETIAQNREQAHEEYQASEQGEVRAQIDEAERIMRLPTPQALKETGAVVGDPRKGPAS